MAVELSPETVRRLSAVFAEKDRNEAAQRLVADCGSNLPFCEKLDAVELERLRFAALKLSGGSLAGLLSAIVLAQTDWRDLLVAASFAEDVTAHSRWWPDL